MDAIKVFLDTNVVLDYYTGRMKNNLAEKVVQIGQYPEFELCISILSAVNVLYVLKKCTPSLKASDIPKLFQILPMDYKQYLDAQSLDIADFEDALQRRYELIGLNPTKKFEIADGDIKDTFYQNLPKNIEKDLQIAQLHNQGVLSLESTLDEMEIVDNTEDELQKLEDEESESLERTKTALSEELPTNNRLRV